MAKKPLRGVVPNLSSDWYWEQDAELRFTRVDTRTGDAGERALAERILGKRRWETGMQIEGGWDAHRVVLESRQPFTDVLMWRDLDDGSRRYVLASGEPVFDARSRFAGYRGVGRDITAQKRTEALLRESEARFRSLTHLSSHWYWEQDAEYRFTRLEGRQVTGGDERLRKRLIGTRRWESGLDIEGGWDAHRAALEARRPFHDVLMWREMSDGMLRYLSVSGEPVFAADGRFAGYRGVGRDVTEQKRAELLLRLEHKVAHVLAAAEDTATGLRAVMRAVCEAEGWACGRYFELDEPAGKLRFQDAWCIADAGFERFVERSRALQFGPGEGLVGRVLESALPMWTADGSTDSRVREKKLAEGTGIRGAFAFAAVSGGRTVGVLSFSSARVREPDVRLVEASSVIGSHVGQFLQRKRAEESLRSSEERFRALTQMSSDFFWETNATHHFTQLVHGPGYPGTDIGDPDAGWTALRAELEKHRPLRDFEFAHRMPNGVLRYYSVSGEPHFSPGGHFLGFRGVGRDTTEVALARERISSLAYNDPLTGLANRTSLGPSLEQAVLRARRRHAKLAVVFIDLDGFKQINDAHGHDAGDALLVEMAARLRRQLRASDLVARLGGDEFLVLLEDAPDAATVEVVARKLLGELRRPCAHGSIELIVTASIGVSVLPDDAADATALMKHSDTAMYAAKQAGKNTLRFYAEVNAANDPSREANASSGSD
jgi:diguanylate cyclase (GGDEF)-like protein/PAS domain S-box-containing protein